MYPMNSPQGGGVLRVRRRRSYFVSLPGNALAAGQTKFSVGAEVPSTVWDYTVWIAPFACTIRNLYVGKRLNMPAGESLVVTIHKEGADTAVTCTMAAGTNEASDTVNEVSVNAGDWVTFKWVASNNGGWVADYMFASAEVFVT